MIVLATAGRGDRLAGGDHRRVLGGAPGDAAGLHPAHARSSTPRSDTIGQIYIPWINWVLMVAVIALVLTFRTSTALASAYGVSVSGTMLIDTLLLALVARATWPTRARVGAAAVRAVRGRSTSRFLVANGVKFLDGAWFPVVLGIAGVHRAAHLAPRPRAAARRDPQGRHPARHLPARADAGAAGARAGHRDLPDRADRAWCRTRCCTTSSTTRCCTSATCS